VSRAECTLRRLALNDECALAHALEIGRSGIDDSPLDERTFALVRLGALLCSGAARESLRWAAELAQSRGATEDQIVAVLEAVAPVAGLARIVEVAPELAIAIGYDIEASLDDAVCDARESPASAPGRPVGLRLAAHRSSHSDQ
jgi:4-carboxymuconolactone decarboxylase